MFPSRPFLFLSRSFLFPSRPFFFPSRPFLFPSRSFLFLSRSFLFPTRSFKNLRGEDRSAIAAIVISAAEIDPVRARFEHVSPFYGRLPRNDGGIRQMFLKTGSKTADFGWIISFAVDRGYFSKMVTHRGEGHSVRKISRMESDDAIEVIPKLAALPVADAERHNYFQ